MAQFGHVHNCERTCVVYRGECKQCLRKVGKKTKLSIKEQQLKECSVAEDLSPGVLKTRIFTQCKTPVISFIEDVAAYQV